MAIERATMRQFFVGNVLFTTFDQWDKMTCDECGWIQVETGERFTDDILLRIYPVCVTTHKGTCLKLLMCHLVRDMIESKPGIKILLPFLKNITEESDLENLIFKMSLWPQTLAIDFNISLSRFGDDRRCGFSRFQAAISCFSEDVYCFVLCLYLYFYLRVKEICSLFLDLAK